MLGLLIVVMLHKEAPFGYLPKDACAALCQWDLRPTCAQAGAEPGGYKLELAPNGDLVCKQACRYAMGDQKMLVEYEMNCGQRPPEWDRV